MSTTGPAISSTAVSPTALERPAVTVAPAVPFAGAAAWLLPVYTALLVVGSVSHQPDPGEAFDDYARYVTTPAFLASHLVASIGGAAVGTLGVIAVAALLLDGPAARAGIVGAAGLVVGNVVTTAVFGAAAFAQPAIGRAHRAGADAEAINRDVYGAPLLGTAVVGLLLLVIGAVVLAHAIARSDRRLRGAATALGAGLALFVVAGFLLPVAQPVAAVAATVGAVVISHRLGRAGARR